MLTDYINAAMALAKYELLEDGSYYGEIEALPGVWADGTTLKRAAKHYRKLVRTG